MGRRGNTNGRNEEARRRPNTQHSGIYSEGSRGIFPLRPTHLKDERIKVGEVLILVVCAGEVGHGARAAVADRSTVVPALI